MEVQQVEAPAMAALPAWATSLQAAWSGTPHQRATAIRLAPRQGAMRRRTACMDPCRGGQAALTTSHRC